MPRYARRYVDEARSDRVLDRAPAVASRRLGAWRGWDRRVAWRNVAGLRLHCMCACARMSTGQCGDVTHKWPQERPRSLSQHTLSITRIVDLLYHIYPCDGASALRLSTYVC
jgi:hypothetical protein